MRSTSVGTAAFRLGFHDVTGSDPGELLTVGPGLAVALVALALTGAAVAWLGRTGYGPAILGSTVRATVQLAVLGMVLSLIVRSLWFTAAFVLLMGVTAGWTAARRIVGRRPRWSELAATTAAVAGPAAVLTAALMLSGVLPARGIAVIPVAGSAIGAAMAGAGLAGKRALEELTARRGELEAGLALGLDPLFVRLELARAAATALIPALDQTRTVGLVTIPGAFVGMVLGGASPLAAAVMQLYVLIAILCVTPIAVVVVTWLVAAGRFETGPRNY
ncbi:ABC transporter permease [Tsukamurella paurometabola]|uniref:ABC transporter permease n=1 Tax=Tsukamurella paurometabola TaxID=2061 RepID=A0ABS5NEL9_TSUPA|nr:ABC transporter permease [Tsukamurella paurometabola]